MDILLSAVLGELTTRSINFFINKISKPTPLDVEDRLRRILLRAQVIIDEATGRHIRNQYMLLQLGMLRDTMYRGYYTLDTLRYQSHNNDRKDKFDIHYRCSSSLSKVNSLCLSSKDTEALRQLQEALDDLSSMILDAEELVLLLVTYPRLYQQPYSMHLQLGNCMFGRQMEAEVVINFLLQTRTHGNEGLDVFPIVGLGQVGKSTLVAHVCKDERVRGHFSEILFFRTHSFSDDELAVFREGFAIKHQNRVSGSNKSGGLLVVAELVGDFNEDAWNKLYYASKCYAPNGGKIIVTSRSNKIVKVGTTNGLTLKYLSREAYWYFFKTLTFGGMDPEMHPRHAHMAMEIAKILNGSFIGANITARLLRDNFDVHFWCKALAFLRGSFRKHISRFGEHPIDLLYQDRPAHLGRMAAPSEDFVLYHQDQRFSEQEVPEIRFQDVMYGCVKPQGRFEVLLWRSQIPPYYSYVFTCEIQELETTAAKRKRSVKHGVTAF
ncbi:hypothetical protein U9M48_011459 [Paspalum notatum var. saurae]|uniref:NB-ARC domain-containing protein n=1 Tax=Paspalum notatum var. saurae TaxID=547442 RepID=A0AAQ3SVF8_PASNO